MPAVIRSYTIYHSPNAYLGSVLLRRAVAERPDVGIVRRPIFVPRHRGVLVAEMLGGKENANAGSYNREDCARWARRYAIPLNYPEPHVFGERSRRWATAEFDREELPARAFYAIVDNAQQAAFDAALFEAAWIDGLDVNEPDTIRRAASRAGVDGEQLLQSLRAAAIGAEVRAALAEFEHLKCPGVPTFTVDGQRFFGKDRIEWLLAATGVAGRTD
ncbi:MAG TPA: DsbA family protein [Vineibacter sp.]|nr:DsbA family protein [Vineibacter sp.]